MGARQDLEAAMTRENILAAGEVPVGWYWARIGPDDSWPKIPFGVSSHKTEVQPTTGIVYRVLHVAAPVALADWPYEDFGEAPEGVDIDPVKAGIFPAPGTTAGEIGIELGEDILEVADEVGEHLANAAENVAKKAAWRVILPIGGALLVVGVAVYLMRKQ